MPFLFKVEVKESKIEGKGLFALEDIPEGAIYCVFESENSIPVVGHEAKQNRVFHKDQMTQLQAEEIKGILHRGFYYRDGDIFIEPRDGSQFINHHADANGMGVFPASKDYRQITGVAKRLIKKGQEILEQYSQYSSEESQWVLELMKKYCPQRFELETKIVQSIHQDKK